MDVYARKLITLSCKTEKDLKFLECHVLIMKIKGIPEPKCGT
jgi:hypothetical protein